MITDIDKNSPLTRKSTEELFVLKLKLHSKLSETMKQHQETVRMFWDFFKRFGITIHDKKGKGEPVSKKRPRLMCEHPCADRNSVALERGTRLATKLVTLSGPTFFLKKLISEFDVDCNTKNETGCSILMMEIWKRDVGNLMALLYCDGNKNKANPSM